MMQLVFVCDSKIKQNLAVLEHVCLINFEFHLSVFCSYFDSALTLEDMVVTYKELFAKQQPSEPIKSPQPLHINEPNKGLKSGEERQLKDPVQPNKRLKSGEAHQLKDPVQPQASDAESLNVVKGEFAFMFWHDPNLPPCSCVMLADHLLQGLCSCALNSGLQPIVLSYQKVSNLPSNVKAVDCRGLLDEFTFQQHLQNEAMSCGVHVPHHGQSLE